jgi:methylmalonyl-CoA/ethylmalonyl-CoA epimerase
MDELNLTFHHTGCITQDIDASIKEYMGDLGFKNISDIYHISQQQVKVCFIDMGSGKFLELVQPVGDNPALQKILKSKNPYYHIGYKVEGFDQAIDLLKEKGYYLVNIFESEAFDKKKCAFLYTPSMHLIELIEQ